MPHRLVFGLLLQEQLCVSPSCVMSDLARVFKEDVEFFSHPSLPLLLFSSLLLQLAYLLIKE